MQSCRLKGVGPKISPSCILQLVLRTMFILLFGVTAVSAFTIQPEEPTVTAKKCQFRGKHFKDYFRVEGEPVILRCPQTYRYLWPSDQTHVNLTWHRNDSAQLVPMAEDNHTQVEDGVLRFLPVSQGDSGTYICTFRNASHCDEMSLELQVLEKTDATLPLISYSQFLGSSESGLLNCPDLSEFKHNKKDFKIQWYKDSVLLDQDNKKFISMKGTTRLLIFNVSAEDEGYYTCAMEFVHEGVHYNVTRVIDLQVKKKTEQAIPVFISPHPTIMASLGSKLSIPCKVSLGLGTTSRIVLLWMANNTNIEMAYPGGRISQGSRREYKENNENYIEVPLIFDPVEREDLSMDFKCIVISALNIQKLHTTVKEAATFSWMIALAPLSLVLLALFGIWMHRRYKQRTGKSYIWTVLKPAVKSFNGNSVK